MANCTSCGRELPAFSTGRLSTLCRECQASENSVAAPRSMVAPEKGSSRISLTTILVGINVALFLLMTLSGVSLMSPTTVQLVKWGADWGPLSLGRQPWRLLTSNYVHIGIIHIALNMWCLFNLGALAKRIFDRWTYLLVYTATGIAGSIASLWWHPTVVGAGASGAIFGLAGALITALYLARLPIPKEIVRANMKSLLTFAGYNLIFGLRLGVDNAAHIGGLASGLVLGAFLSQHLTEAAEVRHQRRNHALVLSLVLLGASMLYLRNQHKEFADIANPYDYLGQDQKALDAFRKKDYTSAATACEKVVELNPKSEQWRLLLGVAYEGAGRPDDAISQFQELLRLNPKSAEAESGLAEAYRAKGMGREAAEASKKAVELKGGR
jgi:membrane associated rhomboid family serine protease/Tfp pilus assembly protein PilF